MNVPPRWIWRGSEIVCVQQSDSQATKQGVEREEVERYVSFAGFAVVINREQRNARV